MNPEEYINFGDVARKQMGQQCQYASRHFCKKWEKSHSYLGEGLRILGDCSDYHSMQIHRDDIAEAVRRYAEMQEKLKK